MSLPGWSDLRLLHQTEDSLSLVELAQNVQYPIVGVGEEVIPGQDLVSFAVGRFSDGQHTNDFYKGIWVRIP